MANLPVGIKKVNGHEITHELVGPFVTWLFVWLDKGLLWSNLTFELGHNSGVVVRFFSLQRKIVRLMLTIPFFVVAELYRVWSRGKRCLTRLGRFSHGQIDNPHFACSSFSHAFVLSLKLIQLPLAEAGLLCQSI